MWFHFEQCIGTEIKKTRAIDSLIDTNRMRWLLLSEWLPKCWLITLICTWRPTRKQLYRFGEPILTCRRWLIHWICIIKCERHWFSNWINFFNWSRRKFFLRNFNQFLSSCFQYFRLFFFFFSTLDKIFIWIWLIRLLQHNFRKWLAFE